jgi:perosamine synthetase
MLGKRYNELFADLKDKVYLPLDKTDYADNIYWVYGMILKDSVRYDAQEIIDKLLQEGIGCRPFFYPMHLQPVFNKMDLYNNEQYPVAEILSRRGFYIPNGLAITDAQVNEVADKLHKILNG